MKGDKECTLEELQLASAKIYRRIEIKANEITIKEKELDRLRDEHLGILAAIEEKRKQQPKGGF